MLGEFVVGLKSCQVRLKFLAPSVGPVTLMPVTLALGEVKFPLASNCNNSLSGPLDSIAVTDAFEERFNPPPEPACACFDVMLLAVLSGTSAGSSLKGIPWFPVDAFESSS